MKNRRIKIIATLVVALGGIGYVAAQSLKEIAYYKMAHEVVENPEPWLAKKTMQIHGFVVAGSIKTEVKDQQTFRTFRIEEGGREVHVRHAGPVPDTFKDAAETVVTGKLVLEDGELWLNAKNGDAGIAAKCPSKYGAPGTR